MGRASSKAEGMRHLENFPLIPSAFSSNSAMLIYLSPGAVPSRASSKTRSSLPRRTSLRLAQSSANANANANTNNAQANDLGNNMNNSYSLTSSNGTRPTSVEVAIPLPKTRLSSHSSSTPSVAEDILGGGPNDYNTPATSVAVTPSESDVNMSRQRISATTRARELRSNAPSLNTRRGLKRDSDGIPDYISADAHSDADLARILQIQEYQEPAQKRQKVSANMKRSSWEIQDSTEDDDASRALDESSEAEEGDAVKGWQPSGRTRAPTLVGSKTIVADSEDSNFTGGDESDDQEDIYENDLEATDSSSALSDEDEPLSLRRSRNGNVDNSSIRATARSRPRPRARVSASRPSRARPSSAPSWMSSRVCDSPLCTSRLQLMCSSSRPSENGRSSKNNTPLSLECGRS